MELMKLCKQTNYIQSSYKNSLKKFFKSVAKIEVYPYLHVALPGIVGTYKFDTKTIFITNLDSIEHHNPTKLFSPALDRFENNLKGIRLDMIPFVLAHENQHHIQHLEKRLNSEAGSWEGVPLWKINEKILKSNSDTALTREEYVNLPWEVDANSVAISFCIENGFFVEL